MTPSDTTPDVRIINDSLTEMAPLTQYQPPATVLAAGTIVSQARAGFVHSGRTVTANQERVTLVVRTEQVQTVEDTYRFIGAKLQTDDLGQGEPVGGDDVATAAQDEAASNGERAHTELHKRLELAVGIVEITIFILVGVIVAVLLSPYSPFGPTALRLLVLVMPGGAAAAIGFALLHQRRRRFVD